MNRQRFVANPENSWDKMLPDGIHLVKTFYENNLITNQFSLTHTHKWK